MKGLSGIRVRPRRCARPSPGSRYPPPPAAPRRHRPPTAVPLANQRRAQEEPNSAEVEEPNSAEAEQPDRVLIETWLEAAQLHDPGRALKALSKAGFTRLRAPHLHPASMPGYRTAPHLFIAHQV